MLVAAASIVRLFSLYLKHDTVRVARSQWSKKAKSGRKKNQKKPNIFNNVISIILTYTSISQTVRREYTPPFLEMDIISGWSRQIPRFPPIIAGVISKKKKVITDLANACATTRRRLNKIWLVGVPRHEWSSTFLCQRTKYFGNHWPGVYNNHYSGVSSRSPCFTYVWFQKSQKKSQKAKRP